MTDIFLIDNGNFTNYGMEHGLAFIACILFIGYVLYQGRSVWTDNQKRKYVTVICALGAFTQLFKVFYKSQTGIFDPTNDIPLHLCNLMTLIMPFVMWYRLRIAWGIIFFWIIAGCAQSIFTPTLTESLPHYEAIRYWMVHAVIILGALYGWYAYRWVITWKDAARSIIGLNLLAAIIYPINLFFNSNYMYLNGKPPGKTFYDLLGPWPDYILTLELVVISFFTIMLIPFYWHKIKYYVKLTPTQNT
jgi:hypothetical integral membrane protein (TIGR02206 family)